MTCRRRAAGCSLSAYSHARQAWVRTRDILWARKQNGITFFSYSRTTAPTVTVTFTINTLLHSFVCVCAFNSTGKEGGKCRGNHNSLQKNIYRFLSFPRPRARSLPLSLTLSVHEQFTDKSLERWKNEGEAQTENIRFSAIIYAHHYRQRK